MQEQPDNMFRKSDLGSAIFTSEDLNQFDGELTFADMGVIEEFQFDEDTRESQQKFIPQFETFQPVSPLGPPNTENFAGSLNFVMEIKATETDRKTFLYSAILNRIYVDMGKNFPIHFSWDVAQKNRLYQLEHDLYVRATVVFSDRSQAEKRVERCLQHANEANNPGNKTIVSNVLRSTRELGTSGVYYCGIPSQADSWFSVVVALPSPGGHAYQFVCKNSCSSGINRRAIDIIFTLEDSCGRVLGRQSVGARVCACPKRDIKRDEAEVGKGKRKIVPNRPDNLKKIKLEEVEDDDKIVYLPKIPIKGIKTMLTGLEVMKSTMESVANEVSKRKDQKALEEYQNCLTSLTTYIENMKKPPQTQ